MRGGELRLAAPRAVVLDGMDETVSRSYAGALTALSKADAGITDIALGELAEIATLNGRGGFAASEAYAWHRRLIEAKDLVGYEYDGFWKSMDTFKEKQELDDLHSKGNAPWQLWKKNGKGPAIVSAASVPKLGHADRGK